MGCKNCKNSGFRKLNETKKNALKKGIGMVQSYASALASRGFGNKKVEKQQSNYESLVVSEISTLVVFYHHANTYKTAKVWGSISVVVVVAGIEKRLGLFPKVTNIAN